MPVGNNSTAAKPGSRLRELGLALPKAPTPLGAYVEASEVGSLLFLSGMLPVVNGKLPITGRLGENLSVEQGREAVRTVYGVQSLPIGTPVIVEVILEIK